MIYAAHQPNYLPWLGYFYKIMNCDVFVILDDVQLVRGRSYQTRVQIKMQGGPQWLTQPVQRKGKSLQKTSEVQFNSDIDWRRKHLGAIRSNYAKTPFFKPFYEQLEHWLMETQGGLSSVNTDLIQHISAALGSKAKFVLSSSYNIETTAGERIAELGERIGGTTYLSGRGAVNYQSEEEFSAHGIEIYYTDFSISPYPQLHGEFAGGMSIVDAIFNNGFEAVAAQLKADRFIEA